jgi:ubiquinone/menaquinone biosynthesis C-methylase UbiE
MDEVEQIRGRYKRRGISVPENKYSLTNPHILMGVQERERKLVRLLIKNNLLPLKGKNILEVGCGTGSNLLDFIRFGASPENITANDLLESRIATAKSRLPKDVRFICCEASELHLKEEYFDITLQSTVFTSILDDRLQEKLAKKMWVVTKPGGTIIWYDFIHANPYNHDVRAVSIKRVKNLFPDGSHDLRRATLFPFISEKICKKFYFPYTLLNLCPYLRMHILCFITKPG